LDERNNGLQESKIVITNPMLYPNKQYINSKIEEILSYSSDKDFSVEIVNHKEEVLTKEELVDQYYGNPEGYFELNDSSSPENHESTYRTSLEDNKDT
jgi:hypothetical protein